VRALLLVLATLSLVACHRREPEPAPTSAEKSATTPPSAPAPVAATAETPPPPASGGATVASADGEQLFQQNCATCHMADGSGVPFLQPSIRGSAWISNENPQLLLSLILRGSAVLGEAAQAYENDMAPFDHLSDVEIAALATRVRERFGQPPPSKPVTPDEVAIARSRPGLP